MFERFTRPARDAVIQAQLEARQLGSTTIGSEHVLLGALWNADGVTRTVIEELDLGYPRMHELIEPGLPTDDEALGSLGIDLSEVRRRVEQEFGPGALDRPADGSTRSSGRRGGHLPFGRDAKKSLELALREAINLKHNYIGVEHLLLGLTRIGDCPAADFIGTAGVDPHILHDQLSRRLREAA
jgi:ATP-dependent Clp protease ATP-binding subunit ClpA